MYFTVPETDGLDTVSSASRVATGDGVLGNTEFIAKEIQKNLGGDLFEIETVQDYPGTHDALLEFAYKEKNEDARPELSSHIDHLDSYDYIFVGYPNWNADLPMPLYTFFEEYDFSGKTLIPFVTHGGSSFSNTIRTIQEYHFTKGFFGTNGVTRRSGCTTPDVNEAVIKKTAMEQCRQCYVLCDASKFNSISSVTFADFEKPIFIIDRKVIGYEKSKHIIACDEEQK